MLIPAWRLMCALVWEGCRGSSGRGCSASVSSSVARLRPTRTDFSVTSSALRRQTLCHNLCRQRPTASVCSSHAHYDYVTSITSSLLRCRSHIRLLLASSIVRLSCLHGCQHYVIGIRHRDVIGCADSVQLLNQCPARTHIKLR